MTYVWDDKKVEIVLTFSAKFLEMFIIILTFSTKKKKKKSISQVKVLNYFLRTLKV